MTEENKETQQEEIKEEKKPCCCKAKKVFAIGAFVVLVAALITAICFENKHIKEVKNGSPATPQEQQGPAQPQAPEGKKPSEYAVGKDYNSVISGEKPVVVLFYADWCKFCIRFMPIYEEVANKYEKDIEFAKVNIDDPKYKNITAEVDAFPTLVIMDTKYDNRVAVPGRAVSSVETFEAEVSRYVRIRKLLDGKK